MDRCRSGAPRPRAAPFRLLRLVRGHRLLRRRARRRCSLPVPIAVQVLAAVLVAVVGIVLVRPRMSAALRARHGPHHSRGVHGGFVGQEVVTLDLVGGIGRVGPRPSRRRALAGGQRRRRRAPRQAPRCWSRASRERRSSCGRPTDTCRSMVSSKRTAVRSSMKENRSSRDGCIQRRRASSASSSRCW